MSRILVLARQLPYPPDAGDRIVTHGFVRALAERGHEVHVLAAERREGDVDDAEALGEFYASIGRVPRSDERFPTSVQKVIRYARGQSHVMEMFDSEAFREAAAVRIHALDPDVVLAQHPYIGQAFLDDGVAAAVDATDAVRITNAHVVEYLAHERHREYADDPRTRLELAFEIPRLRERELAVYEESDRTIVLGERDRRELVGAVSGPVSTQRVALDLDRYDPAAPGEETDGRLLFFGSYEWFPNEDAIRWFCREVFPAIRRAHPDAEVVIAGRGAPQSVRSLAEIPGVAFAGEVDDLEALVRTASVVVAPIRVGGGVRIKVLESMAWGAPVVTTPSGFEGVEATPGEDLVVADTASSLAEATVELLENPERRRALRQSARETIAERYTESAVGAELEANLGLRAETPDSDG